MNNFEVKEHYNLEDYRALMHFLRGPDGCPWDREQTHESIRRNLIEEAYETANAIDRKDPENLKEELGDLLMQVLFHAEMEEEIGSFTLDDVADTACKKLVFRHPHVFQKTESDSAEALRTWEEQKKEEKGQKTVSDTMFGVAETLPALWRAEKIQNKAMSLPGGKAAEPDKALLHVQNALSELASKKENECSAIIGKLLFAAVEAARAFGTDPEAALHYACSNFIQCAEEAESCQISSKESMSKSEETPYLQAISSFYGASGEFS